MARDSLFREKAPVVMQRLMDDFEFSEIQAAGVLGNIGVECAGFHVLHEIGQPEGKGGYGWAQWTGPRRKQFFAWCDRSGLDWRSDEANYGYLKVELEGTERNAISAVHKAFTLSAAVQAFERNFERAGVPNYPARERWAEIALDAFRTG